MQSRSILRGRGILIVQSLLSSLLAISAPAHSAEQEKQPSAWEPEQQNTEPPKSDAKDQAKSSPSFQVNIPGTTKKPDETQSKAVLDSVLNATGTSAWDRLFQEGSDAYNKSQYELAARKFEEASRELKKTNQRDERLIKTRNCIGQSYLQLRKLQDAESAFNLAWDSEKELKQLGSKEAGKTLRGLANLYKMEEKWPKAEEKYKEAIKIQEDALGANSPEVGKLVMELADLYRTRKLYDQAEPLYKLGVDIFNKSEEPELIKADILERTGIFYLEQGKLEQANPFFDLSLKMKDKLSTPYVQTDAHNLGFVTYTCFNGIPNSYHAFTRGLEAEFINVKNVGVLSSLTWQQFNPMWTNIKCQVTIHNNGKTPISAFNEAPKLIVQSPNYHEYGPLDNTAIAQASFAQAGYLAQGILGAADYNFFAGSIVQNTLGFASLHFSPDWTTRLAARDAAMQTLSQAASTADTIVAYKPGHTTIGPGESETFLIYFKDVQFSYAELQVCIGNTLVKFPFALKSTKS